MNQTFRTLFIMLSVCSLMTVTSCKKAAVNGKVASKTTSSTGTNSVTTTYRYDSQGRLLTAQDAAGTVSYQYSASNVTETDVNGTVTIYTLNNQGYAGSDNGGITYTYDNNGFLQTEAANGGGSLSYTINNGDQVSATLINNGTTTYIWTYGSNVDYRDFGLNFLGRRSTHVLNSQQVTAGTNSTTYTFSYNFDSQGRVVTETQTGNGTITTTTYQY